MEHEDIIWNITLFGALQVERGGKVVELPPLIKSRALLAFLALHAGQSFSRDKLIDVFWPDEDIEIARARLRRCLYELRNLLDDAIETGRSGVRLDSGPVRVDAMDFQASIAAATKCVSLTDRRYYLESALALYTGDLFADFYEQPLLDLQQNFTKDRLEVIATLTAICEQLGDLGAAIRYVRLTIAADPIAEENYCTLMRFAAMQGRPSDVLKQYQELEKVLRDEIGEEPSAATRELMLGFRRLAQDNATHKNNGNGHATLDRPTAFTPDLQATPTPSEFTAMPAPILLKKWAVALAAITVICGLEFFVIRMGNSPRNPLHATANSRLATRPVERKAAWIAAYQKDVDERDSEATAMTVDAGGNIYITGFVNTLHNDVDFLTIKYSPEGKLIWRNRVNGAGNDVDRARSIAVDKLGNVYVTGESLNGHGNNKTTLSGLDIVTVKYSPEGTELWRRSWNGQADGEDRPAKMKLDKQGNLLIVGVSGGLNGPKGAQQAYEMPFLLKYDANGNLKWQVLDWNDPNHPGRFHDVDVDGDDNIYAVGEFLTNKNFVPNLDIRVAKVAPNGERVWERLYASPLNSHDYGRKIAVDLRGNAVITGLTYSGDRDTGGNGQDVITVAFDSEGNRKWEKRFDFAGFEDGAEAISFDNNGSVVVAGWATGEYRNDCLVLKYDAKGNELWRKLHNGKGSFDDNAYAVAVDGHGFIAAAGREHNGNTQAGTGTDFDYFTALYSPAGEMLWYASYDRAKGSDRASAVSFDVKGDVIVTGRAQVDGNNFGIVTIKYTR